MRACSLEKSGMHESWFLRSLVSPKQWNHGFEFLVSTVPNVPPRWSDWWYWSGNDRAEYKRTTKEGAD